MIKRKKLSIEIYCDGADLSTMLKYNSQDYIKGFTTNPTLLKNSGVKDFKNFAKRVLTKINSKPVSLEVFSDSVDEMHIQAEKISSLGKNVYVKIPITNSKGKTTIPLIKKLLKKNIKINVTAVFTMKQILLLKKYLANISSGKLIISIFAGRIADTGVDPSIIISKSVKLFKKRKNIKILWASTREVLNIIQANDIGCHIITVPINFLSKLNLIGKNLKNYSLETVKDFYLDAKKSNFKI
jgi:transaldolase